MIKAGLAILLWASMAMGADLKMAVFQADVTPKLGEPLIWVTPAKVVNDPLLAKGVIIQNGKERMVLCAVDWCGMGNRAHMLFRKKLADAVGTDLKHVEFHSIHQHTAPYVDLSASDLLQQMGAPVHAYPEASLEEFASRIAQAAKEAAAKMTKFDRVGMSSAKVEMVASARRLKGPDGKITVRYSTSGKAPAMAAAPEGDIDPLLRTVTLAQGDRALVRLHYYATHPQTFCCEGTVTADIAGAARESMEKEEGVPQIYFTGAAGDVTVGKYNDESPAARERLAANLLAAMRKSAAQVKFAAANDAAWKWEPLVLPKPDPAVDTKAEEVARYRAAMRAVFAKRKEPLDVVVLRIGPARIVHMPGEPMLEFQKYATSLRPGEFVAFAGYGDIAPGYICTDAAFQEGGYEPSASNSGPGEEAAVKAALKKALK